MAEPLSMLEKTKMFWNKRNKLNLPEYLCSECGKAHFELPALGFKTPFHYDILDDEDKANIAEVSEDFCIIRHPEQNDRFIRTVLTIPIIDSCEVLDYGIWVSLSEKSFDDYYENFKKEKDEPVYFGMICNEIKDYKESTLGLHVNVQVRSGGIRPEIIPHENSHLLIKDWENGISIKEAENRIKETINNVG